MGKVLIVEDEREILTLLEGSLKRADFDIVTAADGKEAIEKVQQYKPDVVVLDIMLPEINGLEVLKWIKQHTPATLVMLATAKGEIGDLKKGYSQEADYYITKPYKIEEIVKGITVLLSLKED